jgi:hypothetical protein
MSCFHQAGADPGPGTHSPELEAVLEDVLMVDIGEQPCRLLGISDQLGALAVVLLAQPLVARPAVGGHRAAARRCLPLRR